LSDSLITGIHHSTVLVRDIEQALKFYIGLLELEKDMSRPDLGYPGAWLNVGNGQIHLMELPNPDPVTGRPQHGGRDRHLALTITDLAILQSSLEEAEIEFTLSKSGRKALFCRDYDGNALEFIEK
jgi:glyoxylase I family protein